MIEKHFVKAGAFSVDGLNLAGILAVHPTPCYVYSAGVIREKYRTLKSHLPGFDVLFSFKANPNLAICRMFAGLGSGADVSSLGELKGAFKVGFKPENILFVGPAKTEEELRYAIANDIYALIAESPYELRLIDDLAGKLRKHASVILRINTLEAPAAAEIMAGGPSKFGIDEEVAAAEVGTVGLKHSSIIGIHSYAASQVLDWKLIARQITYVADLAIKLSREAGFTLKCIDFGGGLGVPYGDEPELDLGKVGEAAEAARQKVLAVSPGCRLVLEVGRFLTAESGVFLSKVVRLKQSRGKCFVIADAGINGFTRPVFMGLNHEVRLLNKIAEPNAGIFDVGGPICTPLDILAHDVPLPTPEIGDTLGIFGAGAYGYSMSMVNFMSLGWPPEIMVDGGKASTIRKARRADDLFEDQNQK